MSKSKNPKRELRLLKLVSGNTVLADVLKTPSGYELTKPMEVVMIPHPDPQKRETMITLMDFIPACSQEVVHINSQHVITTATAVENIIELYKRVTNPSPIAQPTQQLVLPPGA